MLEIVSLTKEYQGHTAVSELDWTIREHGVYGFLGPNGAGKSTTMNIITGCLAATSGDVFLDGCSVLDNSSETRKKIGYLPEIPPLYTDMTPEEYLYFIAEMKLVPKNRIGEAVNEVIGQCSLETVRKRLIRFLSKGYRQRVGIAQAVLGDPSLIILDEPMVGLDPLQIMEIRELIRQLGEDHIVVLSSHILSEVQAISDRVLIIKQGRKLAEGSPSELTRLFGTGSGQILLTVKADRETVSRLLEKRMTGLSFIENSGDARCSFRVNTDSAEKTAEELFYIFAGSSIPIVRCEYPRTDLEEIFLELTEKET